MRKITFILFLVISSIQIVQANDDYRRKLVKKQIKYATKILSKRIEQNNAYLKNKQHLFVDFIIDEYKERGLGSFISKEAHQIITEKLSMLNIMTGLHYYVYISPGVPVVEGRNDIMSNPKRLKKYSWYGDIVKKANEVQSKSFTNIYKKYIDYNKQLKKQLKTEHLFFANSLIKASKFKTTQKDNGVLLFLRMDEIYEIPFWSVNENRNFQITEYDIVNLMKGHNDKKLRHVKTEAWEFFYASQNIDTKQKSLTNVLFERRTDITINNYQLISQIDNITAPYKPGTNQILHSPKRDIFTKYYTYFVAREIFKFRERQVKSRRVAKDLQYILQGFDAYDMPLDAITKFKDFENHPIFRLINNNSKIDRYRLANPTYTFKILDQYKTRLTQNYFKYKKKSSQAIFYVNDFTKDNGVFALKDGENFKIGYKLESKRTIYIDVSFHEKRPSGIKLIGTVYNKESSKNEEVYLTTIPLLNTFNLERERQRVLLVEYLTTLKQFLINLSEESKKAFEESQHITLAEWFDLFINGGAVVIGIVITASTDGYGSGALFIAFDNFSASSRKIRDKWNGVYYDPNNSKYKSWGAQVEEKLGGTNSGSFYDLGGLFVGAIGSSAKLSNWAQGVSDFSKKIPKSLQNKKILPLFYRKTAAGKQKLQNAEQWLNSLNRWVARSGVGLSLFGKGKIKDNADLEKYITFLRNNPPAREVERKKQNELIDYFDKLIKEAKKKD